MAATTAATATVVPTRALRTGTAVRPWPGSNAIRTPRLPGTDPASPSAGPSREVRRRRGRLGQPERARARDAARSAAGSTTSSGAAAMMTNPRAEDGQVDLHPGAGLGGAGRADGHQRGRRDRDPDGEHGPRDGHGGHPGQRQRGQPGPAHAEGAQDREFRRVEDELAAQQLPDDGQRDQARERGEDRQRGRFRPDRPLRPPRTSVARWTTWAFPTR